MHENGRSLAAVISDLKEEAKEFTQTRVQMLLSEMREKVAMLKASIPLMLVGALLGLVGFTIFSFALVALVMTFFTGPLAWFWGALIVGVLYLLLAAMLAWVGYRQISTRGLAPQRTLRVLRDDQLWLSTEARTTQL